MNINIKLGKLLGYEVFQDNRHNFYLKDPDGKLVNDRLIAKAEPRSIGSNGFYAEEQAWDNLPNWAESLDECFKLACRLKLCFEIRITHSPIKNHLVYECWLYNDGRHAIGESGLCSPSVAACLGLISWLEKWRKLPSKNS